ncbi:MAG: hypothetical protein LBR25_06940 [Erysipelotrichaceae bacterium]|jgi:hypothetical protein|nr:hypothetical protein [Erysipelotrichaceae bacterium]
MNIIGRTQEIKSLNHCLQSRKPEFLVVYGRRRVGKTYLIREFFHNDFCFTAPGREMMAVTAKMKRWSRN